MDEGSSAQARRRNTSLNTAGGNARGLGTSSQRHQRVRSKGIAEVEEGKQLTKDEGESDSSGMTGSTNFEMDSVHSDGGIEDDEETGLTGEARKKRRKRKRRNTMLDKRVAGDVKITKEEDRMVTQSLIRSALVNVLLVALWYLFSISISLYNKKMFQKDPQGDPADGRDDISFPFPLFTTCLHMLVQFSLASLVLYFFPGFRPRHDSLESHHAAGRTQPRQESPNPQKPLMTRWFYLTRIGPCGAATGLDIGLGNMSLRFISLTFYTMCKSSVLGFVLLFAFLFRLEKPSWKLGAIITTMTIGVVMMVAGETAFNILGFILVMSAAMSSGFRWSLTQILLLRNPATSNPFSSIFFLAPVMFLSLLVIAVPVEGLLNVRDGLAVLMKAKGTALGILILLFPGTLAFCMTASEFALLKRTSVVTLSICGIFKEVVTISAASYYFGDSLTPINLSGLVVTIGSIAAYNYIKIRKMRDEARMDAHLATEEYAPVLSTDPDNDNRGIKDSGAGRQSTSNLIRNSLSLQTAPPPDRGTADNPAKASPVKRPEDLD